MFTAPSIIDSPDFGRITVLFVLPYDSDNLVLFQNAQGQTVLGLFDASGDAKGQPVRVQKNGSGLFEFDFPGVSPAHFVTGPSGNVTSC